MRKILCLFAIVSIVSCSLSNKPQGLARAESLVDTLPDSAMRVLTGIHAEVQDYSERYRMEYLLLYAEAMNKLFIPMDTVKFMPKVLSYYEKHGSQKDLCRAYYMMGSVYRDKGDSPMALKNFLDATSCVDTTGGQQANFVLLSRVYGQIGMLFYKQRLPKRAVAAWEASGDFAMHAGDTLTAIQSIEFRGYAYALLGNKDSSLCMAEKAYYEYKKIDKENYASASLSTMIYHYTNKGELKKAKELIHEFIEKTGLMNEQGEIESGHEMFYHLVGKYYEKDHKPDSAAYYYRKLIAQAKNLNSLENGYRGLLNVYSTKGVADSVTKYANLFADANDSSSLLISAEDVNRAQALYDYSEYQKIANEKSQANSRLLLILVCVVTLVIIISLVLYIVIKQQSAKRQKKLQALNDKYTDTVKLYGQALQDMKMMEQGFEDAKKAKTEEIRKLQQALSTYSEYSNVEDWNAEQSLMTNPVVIRLHEHAKMGNIATASEWSDLIHLMSELSPKFYRYIKDDKFGLSDREVFVCILTRLRFLPFEIGCLLGLKKQSVSNLRSSLNEKIFRTSGTKTFNSNIYQI